jgi:hypothetical protein
MRASIEKILDLAVAPGWSVGEARAHGAVLLAVSQGTAVVGTLREPPPVTDRLAMADFLWPVDALFARSGADRVEVLTITAEEFEWVLSRSGRPT